MFMVTRANSCPFFRQMMKYWSMTLASRVYEQQATEQHHAVRRLIATAVLNRCNGGNSGGGRGSSPMGPRRGMTLANAQLCRGKPMGCDRG